MHFWIDKRSSQLHQYGGGRRGPGGAGGFYSQNFGTHRNSHHPPPSLCHHPHRIRNRPSSTTNATTTAASSSTNNGTNYDNNVHTLSITPNNNNNHQSSTTGVMTVINGNPASSSAANIALQYPHQQPHQVQGQHAWASSYGSSAGHAGVSSSNTMSGSSARLSARSSNDAARSNATSFFSNTSQQQPIIGGGILAISGSSSGAMNAAAAALNPPMAIVSENEGEGVSSTTVLTFPPSAAAVSANPSNSINVQLISCVNINPENRGIDLSWRNPYHVPGSSIGRYSRDVPPSVIGAGSSIASSRGTRGRRSSSASSTALGRGSIGTVNTPSLSNHSQSSTNATPDGFTDHSIRSERTSFDRDTIAPQLSLTSPEAADQSSGGTSTGGRPSLENDPGWACTKRVGLTLCFLAFILLGTVGAKFMIQGPGVIDTSRAGKAEAAAYFLFTELLFVAFAMALFFTGVACLRKRTNDYLLRQFNQYILSSSSTTAIPGGGVMSNIPPGQDTYDFEYYDGTHPPGSGGSPSRVHHQHLHHNLHHGGFHHYRHHHSNGSLLEEGDFGSGVDLTQSPRNFHGAGPIHYPAHYGSSSARYGRSKPPPYHIALYLPLPEGMGGGNSPTDENSTNDTTNGFKTQDRKTSMNSSTIDGIGFIDSSSIKDAQDEAGGNNVNCNSIENSNNDERDSGSRNGGREETTNRHNRSETPPPPYSQI